MSTVFVHVGQCGNQIGQSFWKKASKDDEVKKGHTFFGHDGKPRAVLVDSEPKVVQQVAKTVGVKEENVVSGKRGRGTNWALGYHGLRLSGEDHILENTLNSFRQEVERCDSFCGGILMHSLSGGTGSGLGSRICQEIRDAYPMSHLVSCTFAPCGSGESPLQHYNSLLTLAALQRHTDGIVLMHNDEVLWRLHKHKGGDPVSFSNINTAIAGALCGGFLPTESLTPSRGRFSIGMEPWEMIRSVCPMPALKFVNVNHQARSKLSWEELMRQVLHGVRQHDKEGQPFGSLANLVVARGDSTGSALSAMQKLEHCVKNTYHSVSWNPFPVDIWTAKSNYCGPPGTASITIAANHGSVVDYLETVLERSKVMFEAGAYLHWYWRYGATKEDFEEGFEVVRNVIDDYKDALREAGS